MAGGFTHAVFFCYSKTACWNEQKYGAVSEWLKEMVSKTIELARVPGVRIPPAPMLKILRIFSLGVL